MGSHDTINYHVVIVLRQHDYTFITQISTNTW